ncbi:MAG: pyridoxal phosphate-dependent aminotransferase [Kosmotoga sp.]|nr:MAG: pyridoxal phosphate-dependent aminotransferase [Kosmotoga sp.]
MKYSRYVEDIKPSITLEFNQMALDMIDKGVDVIKLTAGEPDFPTPKKIINAAIKAMKEGKTKYTHSSGILPLRERISDKLLKDNGLNYSPDEIVVTNGGKQAIYNTLLAIINPGDEVIILTPSWVSYGAQVRLCGGVPTYVETRSDNGFIPTTEDIESSITDNTKAIIINTPNNPTGAIYSEKVLKEIAELATNRNLFVISDEVYEKLAFDREHTSIASFEGMKERCAVINAFSKTYSMTGWRIGYVAGSRKLAKRVAKIQSHQCSNVNTISQYAAIEAFNVDITYMVDAFKERRSLVNERLSNIKLEYVYPKGAFYFFINIKKFLNNSLKDSLSFCKSLLEEARVGLVPGSAFNAEGYIRLSYASSIEELNEGLNRMKVFISGL